METQFGIEFVIVVAVMGVLIAISLVVRELGRARLDSKTQAEHEKQTQIMAKRLAGTGTEWRIAQDDANGNTDSDNPADQSIEAQLDRFS